MPYGPPFQIFPKDPSAVLDYGIDLSPVPTLLEKPWLAPGEIVTALTVTPDEGITVESSSINTNAGGIVDALLIAWVSGGVIGTTYNVHFEFTTSLGRTDTRTIQLQCMQR
jgi:hypothetical protein